MHRGSFVISVAVFFVVALAMVACQNLAPKLPPPHHEGFVEHLAQQEAPIDGGAITTDAGR
jgi:hypothetical protein